MTDTDIDAILAYLRSYLAEHDYRPTLDEIAEACGKSKTGICLALSEMEGAGLVRHTQRYRGWEAR